MTDFISFLYDPYIEALLASVIASALVVLFLRGQKKTLVLERLKPGWSELKFGKEQFQKNPGETYLALRDGRKYLIPEEETDSHETVHVPKKMRLKKGYYKLYGVERDKVVKFSNHLIDKTEQLITPGMVPKITGRGSLKRLATAKGALGGGWTMIIMAVGVGLGIGYIMYPQFNHAAPVIEYCRQAVNGTFHCGATP